MKSKCSEECKLEYAEGYITPKAFLCDVCSDLVLRDYLAFLVVFTYVDKTFPVFFSDQTEQRSLKTIKCCSKCGEDL